MGADEQDAAVDHEGAARPPVPPAAGQTLRMGVGCGEERPGGGGAPVDQQAAAVPVGEPRSAHVHGFAGTVVGAVAGGDHAAQCQVQAEAFEQTQPRGQPANVRVPFQGILATAPELLPQGGQALTVIGPAVFECGRDGGDMPFVRGDEGGVRLGRQVLRQGEGRGGVGGGHQGAPIRFEPRSWHRPGGLRQGPR